MTVQFRANALAGITLARELWAPLRVLVDGRLAGHIRKHIIAGIIPYLAKGARASAMVCIHCLKGHRVDPVVALVLKLVTLLAKGGETSAYRVLGCLSSSRSCCISILSAGALLQDAEAQAC